MKRTYKFADDKTVKEKLNIMEILLNLSSVKQIEEIYRKYFRMTDYWWKEFFKTIPDKQPSKRSEKQ